MSLLKLPEALIESLHSCKDFDENAFRQCHAQVESITSIRYNPNKINKSSINPGLKPVPWASNAFYLKERPSFTLDPLLHAGCYYVQEACSMFLEQYFQQLTDLTKPMKVLDLCAAPGGKSTHIAALLHQNSLLLSNELIAARNAILEENLVKWGDEKIVITQNDAKDFTPLEQFFDVIVVDAPCSGSGLFRKDPNAIKEWSTDSVNLCSQRQKRILAAVLPALKENGLLIYSTCSYSPSENEEILDWLSDEMQMQTAPVEVAAEWNISTVLTTKGNTGYRFWPYKTKGEGFFIGAFQKIKATPIQYTRHKTKVLQTATKDEIGMLSNWIKQDAACCFLKHQDDFLAINTTVFEELPRLKEYLYIKLAGITLGQIAKNNLVPAHALAVSTILQDNIATIALTYEQAMQYLRKNELLLPDAPKGWLLVQYENYSLGFIKNLGNRCNNYYPKNWRILMSPDKN